jgi:hypothetical protein
MPNKILTIDQVVAQLESTAPELSEMTSGLSRGQLRARRSGDDWSAGNVLAHLRACADVWGACMASIVEGQQKLRAVNPRTWIKQTDYLEQDFEGLLHSFARQRNDLLAWLKPLPPAAWARSATVTGAGAALKRDVLCYGQKMAGHERAHVKQIARMVRT